MSDYTIIDRRKNPGGKNLTNRQRFLKRVRNHVKGQVRDAMNTRKIKSKDGENIVVPVDSINEPNFDYDRNTGEWEKVLPGNRDFIVGDHIVKPKKKGKGKGKGEGSTSGPDQDDFHFSISREEYLDMVFEDLELPDLIKRTEKAAIAFSRHRAGYQATGSPSTLDLIRSLKNSLGRRLALRRPKDEEVAELQQRIDDETLTNEERQEATLALEKLMRKRTLVPWIDPIDIRYKRWEQHPIPNARAVMFCLMDVSGSMGQKEKEIAKRFYLLLYLFLQRKYDKVDIVFVRHTEKAKECNEDEFFNSQESGGTVISTGLELVNKIINERYPLDSWNIYVVQASDGDNYTDDNEEVVELLHVLLPKVQHYVYAEVRETNHQNHLFYNLHDTSVWAIMKSLSQIFKQLCHVKIDNVVNVVPVFRQVFSKEPAGK